MKDFMGSPVKRQKYSLTVLPEEQIAKALWACNGFQCHTAAKLGVSSFALADRIRKSPYLQEQLHEIKEMLIDNVEATLLEIATKQQNLQAIMFWLKNKAKHRGYGQNNEIVIPAEFEEKVSRTLDIITECQQSLKSSKTISQN